VAGECLAGGHLFKVATEVATAVQHIACFSWSERRDLNSGPLAPHGNFSFLHVPVES
jgi:hypothetical protein